MYASQSAYAGFATPVRTPSTSYHPSYSQALTPTDASSKAVRFQSQPLPPQTQQQPQQLQQHQQQQASSSSALTPTPNRSPYYIAPSAPTPASAPSSALQTQSQSPHSNALTAKPSTPSSMTGTRPNIAPAAAVVGTTNVNAPSSIALSRRIKWNVGALGLLWILPALTTRPRDAYWAVLDQIYMRVGGNTDELVDGVVGWTLWAISVVLLFNAVEAAVIMRRSSSLPPPSATTPQQGVLAAQGVIKPNTGAVLGMHSPQVAKSINFVAASRLKGSPKTRTSNIGAGSPISHSSPLQQQNRSSPSANTATPASDSIDYSQFSPSLRRASSPITTSSSPTHGSNFGNNSGSRMGTPISSNGVGIGIGVGGNQSSPLAAFRARHASGRGGSPSPSSIRARSITPSMSGSGLNGSEVDLSVEGGEGEDGEGTFLGDESFEVDRALKSLRNSLGGGLGNVGVASTPAPFR